MENENRTQVVLKDKFQKLKQKSVAILGVGGVGGYVFEMFVRLGVKRILVVDCDKFDKTNLNRQILCTTKTLNKQKVLVAKNRAKLIDKTVNVETKNLKIDENNVDFLADGFDYVIDAIDDIKAKVAVIKFCKRNDINILSCMGTGNRYKMPNFEVCDIKNTSYDGLARKLRTELKKENISSVKVVFTKEQPEKTSMLGSVIYYPLMCAGTVVSYVTNELIK